MVRALALLDCTDDEKPRDVAKAGMTLRQLYQLKKDADAWNQVVKLKVRKANTTVHMRNPCL